MKTFTVTYKKPYKRGELDCTVYALSETLAIASFHLSHPLCTIIHIEEN
jgi:predicted secreted Zn-dependent protease